VRAALTHGLDLTGAPRKSLLRALADHCADPAERRTLLFLTARSGREAYRAQVSEPCPSLPALLARFASCAPPLEALLDALPPLAPRQYSLAASPLESPGRLQVALSVVRTQTAYGPKHGVATTWLERLCAPLLPGAAAADAAGLVKVAIYMRDGGAFKPPGDLAAPWIMVGPGTGGLCWLAVLAGRLAG
jgi:NADPH-ferrihemoprotein reductase